MARGRFLTLFGKLLLRREAAIRTDYDSLHFSHLRNVVTTYLRSMAQDRSLPQDGHSYPVWVIALNSEVLKYPIFALRFNILVPQSS